jgi:hypothetical protein
MRSKCDVSPDSRFPLDIRSWVDSRKGRCQIGTDGASQTIRARNESHVSWLFSFESLILSSTLSYEDLGSSTWQIERILVPPRSIQGPTERRFNQAIGVTAPSQGVLDDVILVHHRSKMAEPGWDSEIEGEQFALVVDVQP